MAKRRLAVLMTVHNRCDKTLLSLRSVLLNRPDDLEISAFVVDDGSTDGTSSAIQTDFPDVYVVHGNGALYWNGGMCKAYEAARERGEFDDYLWLNNDTVLRAGALRTMAAHAKTCRDRFGRPVVVVGTTADSVNSGHLTYGGRARTTWYRPLYYRLVRPDEREVTCDTMNGNCVLVPSEVVAKVGWLDSNFVHGLGDYDYGFRVSGAGFPIVVAPSVVGDCARNEWPDRAGVVALSLAERWRRTTGPKLFPVRPWLRFVRRHVGLLWPVFFFRPYIEVVLPWAFKRLR